MLPVLLALAGISWSLMDANSLATVVNVAPQTELGTHTGLYYFSTAAAVIGPNIAGFLIEALGGDYGVIYLIALITLAFAFVLMLGAKWRGRRTSDYSSVSGMRR